MICHSESTLALELVCDGLQFPEGPIWMRDGSIILVEVRGKTLTRVAPDGSRSIVAEFDGGPNGAAIGPDGAVYVCNNGGMAFVDLPDGVVVPVGPAEEYCGGSLQRIDLVTGRVTTLYNNCASISLNSPNDLVFDAHGGIWFTDMGRSMERTRDTGTIYYAMADGSEIRQIRGRLLGPNGIGLSPDGNRLYFAETLTSRVWAHDILSPGVIAPPTNLWTPGDVLGPLPGYQSLDSLALDGTGAVCVATLVNGGITAFSPDGKETTHYPVPDAVTTNLCFGGADMRDVWITASSTGKLYKARWPHPGLALAHYC